MEKELAEIKITRENILKEYKNLEEKLDEIEGIYTLKETEIEALTNGLNYLYNKKLNNIII